MKVDYIKYYEKMLNKTWKQLYLNSTDIKIYTDDPTIEEITDMFGTTKWWESELKEFK